MHNPNFTKEHVNEILKHINLEAIRARKFKAGVDTINASASVIDPYLFEKLGVETIYLNDTPDGKFAHKPEPLKENLSELSNLVKEKKLDIGFAQDPDADRLVLVDENGEVIFEECTLALAVENVLSKNPNRNIAVNLSTSEMSAEIARKYGGKCIKTKVGEGNVVDGILKNKAIMGGEGVGGVIYPLINTVRDSFVGIALILELMAERGETISECVKELPEYFMKKDKWEIVEKDLFQIYRKLKARFSFARIDEQDGLRFDFEDGSWIHLRPSNTEPIIRLIGEARDEKSIERLFKEVMLTLSSK